jgi:hypothetical protein
MVQAAPPSVSLLDLVSNTKGARACACPRAYAARARVRARACAARIGVG